MERIELLRVGIWRGFEITDRMLEHLEANFSDRIPIDDGMPSRDVAEIPLGWLVAVKKEGNVLIGDMEPTKRGTEILKAHEIEKAEFGRAPVIRKVAFRWSPVIQVEYRDPLTGERNGVRLCSVILEKIPISLMGAFVRQTVSE